MKKNNITLTVIANMTSNYGEGLGNISSVQKVFRNGKTYATRSRESLKNAIMVTSGFYDDLQASMDGATQKFVSSELNVSNCRALEGGYMNTAAKDGALIRNSSFYLTDAVACEEFVNETRFHNNLYLASTFAKQEGMNLQKKGDAEKCGLMPYQYEYDKSLKQYSLTIDLEMIGEDANFEASAAPAEKASRVNDLLSAVESLSLVVKGNLDNAEPLFVVGGFCACKTHYFENVVSVHQRRLTISQALKDKIANGCGAALLPGGTFDNESEIVGELHPVSVAAFFADLREQVNAFYGV